MICTAVTLLLSSNYSILAGGREAAGHASPLVPQSAPALMGTFRPAPLVSAARSAGSFNLQAAPSSPPPGASLSSYGLHPELHSSKVAIASSMRSAMPADSPAQPSLSTSLLQPAAVPDRGPTAEIDMPRSQRLSEGELSQAQSLSRPSSSGSFASACSLLRTAQASPSQSPQHTARARQPEGPGLSPRATAQPAQLTASQVQLPAPRQSSTSIRPAVCHVLALQAPLCSSRPGLPNGQNSHRLCTVSMRPKSIGHALARQHLTGQCGSLQHCVQEMGGDWTLAASPSMTRTSTRLGSISGTQQLQHTSVGEQADWRIASGPAAPCTAEVSDGLCPEYALCWPWHVTKGSACCAG